MSLEWAGGLTLGLNLAFTVIALIHTQKGTAAAAGAVSHQALASAHRAAYLPPWAAHGAGSR